MSRQPKIIVSLVANDPPARLTKHAIAMDFTVARAFRKIEEPDAGIGRLQTLDGGANRVIDAIADDGISMSSIPCACTLATASGRVAARRAWVGMRMLARRTGVPRHPATRRYVAITRRSDHRDAATVAWAALVEDPALRISVCEAGIFVHAATIAVAMCRNARKVLYCAPRPARKLCGAD